MKKKNHQMWTMSLYQPGILGLLQIIRHLAQPVVIFIKIFTNYAKPENSWPQFIIEFPIIILRSKTPTFVRNR